jgi:hypothetical protein
VGGPVRKLFIYWYCFGCHAAPVFTSEEARDRWVDTHECVMKEHRDATVAE